MILLDTCVLVFDALTPERLTPKARQALDAGERRQELTCADISLWEMAMLIQKGRIQVKAPSRDFITHVLQARGIKPLAITSAIAERSASDSAFAHADPADRLIAATAIEYKAKLVTSDQRLRALTNVKIIW